MLSLFFLFLKLLLPNTTFKTQNIPMCVFGRALPDPRALRGPAIHTHQISASSLDYFLRYGVLYFLLV